MEVRVCPNCGTENKKSRSTCANCYASLASAPATESGAGTQPAASQGPAIPGAPMQKEQARHASSPVGTQPRPQAPPPGVPPTRVGAGVQPPYSSSEPASGGSMAWLFILIGLLVVVGIAVLMGSHLNPFAKKELPEPKVPADKVVASFLEAKKERDYKKVKQFISAKSAEDIETMFSSRQMKSAGFTLEDACDAHLWSVSPTPKQLRLSTYTTKSVSNEEAEKEGKRVVRVNLTALPVAENAVDMGDKMALISMVPEIDFYLINENAEWKIDLEASSKQAPGKPMSLPKL